MKTTILPVLATITFLANVICAAPTLLPRHGPMEVHSRIHPDHEKVWKRSSTPHEDHKFEAALILHAHNQTYVDEVISELTNPTHSRFRQWLSPEEAWALTAPHPDTVAEIVGYLAMNGVHPGAVRLSKDNRTIAFDTTVKHANSLFEADYGHHTNKEGRSLFRTHSYSLPKYLRRHIHRVTPGASFSLMRKYHQGATVLQDVTDQFKRTMEEEEARNLERRASSSAPTSSKTSSGSSSSSQSSITSATSPGTSSFASVSSATNTSTTMASIAAASTSASSSDAIVLPTGPPPWVKPGFFPFALEVEQTAPSLGSGTATCYQSIYRNCLRALYHIPSPPVNDGGVSVGTLNLRPIEANAADLKKGFAIYPNIPADYLPQHIEISVAGVTPGGTDGDPSEPDLDLEVIVPLVYPMTVYDFEAPDNSDDSIYGSIAAMGQQAGVPRPTVLSVSYGENEAYQRFGSYCTMTDGLIAQGTTLLAASGDGGDQDMQYPALCPHWIAVGAAEIASGRTVTAASVAQEAVAFSSTYQYKGAGGFSDFVLAPSYQLPAIQSFNSKYQSGCPPYKAVQNHLSAATPDISAQGQQFVIAYSGGYYYFDGTSGACPVSAALIGILNANLINAGRSPIGNPLPAFYANSGTLFRDVTSGNNNNNGPTNTNSNSRYVRCTTTTDWPAISGWDPATGLGTPIYDRLYQFYSS